MTSAGGHGRSRIVVLVDNHVVGDSRVQKAALAAAAAGHRVTLLGRAPEQEDSFELTGPQGEVVEVRRVPVPFTLASLEHRVPRRRWRFPGAYTSAEQSSRTRRRLAVLARDLHARRLLARQRPGQVPGTGAVRLQLARVRLIVARGWFLLRQWQFVRAAAYAKAPAGVAERLGLAVRSALVGPGAWRGLDPVLLDMEAGFGPVLDELRPDLIHANDFRTCGVAVRAAARAQAEGRRTRVLYDVHESVAGVTSRSRRWLQANVGHEAEYIRAADAVITVSPRLAELLRERYRLPAEPGVVLNAPMVATTVDPALGGIRAACGVDDEAALLVYVGSAAVQRGLESVVDALAEIPDLHAAFLLSDPVRCEELADRAGRLGVADRLHLLPYVPQDQVVPFIRGATAGVIPILHLPNHEIALITKYFEFAQARLPLVVSDVEVMARTTRELGIGEVFRAADVADLVAAITRVRADRAGHQDSYRRAGDQLDAWTWPAQARLLVERYELLLADPADPAGPADPSSSSSNRGRVTSQS